MKDVNKWYTEKGAVFKLKETGAIKRTASGFEPEVANECYISVQVTVDAGSDMASKEEALAKHIAHLLNTYPYISYRGQE